MDVNGKYTMDDMSAIDRFIAGVRDGLPSKEKLPAGPAGEFMAEAIRFMVDMLDIQRRIALHEAESSFDEMAEVEGGL